MTGDRILIVADDAFDRRPENILVWTADFIATAHSVHVIAPLVASRVEWATDADGPALVAAERLRQLLVHAEAAGVEATGEVTRDSPVDAIKTKLMGHTYDRIIVGVREDMNWQEKDLVSRIQAVTDIPVDAVVVPTPES